MSTFAEWADVHKALADPTRLHILALLAVKDLCVCELVDALKEVSQPTVSRHLSKLRQAKLVQERRVNQWVYYSISASSVQFLQDILSGLPSVESEIVALDKNYTIPCHIRPD